MSRPAGSAARPSAASTTIAATSRCRRADWSALPGSLNLFLRHSPMCNCTSWMRNLAQARSPYSRSWSWISGFACFTRAWSDESRLVCRFDRRRDQLDGVVAVPFRRSRNGGDLATLAIDQHRGRHSQRPAYGFKFLKNFGFLVTKIAEPGQIDLFPKIFGLFGVPGIDVDGDHLEIRSAEPGLQALERGHLLAAGHAPGGPQVHQHRASAPVGELFG